MTQIISSNFPELFRSIFRDLIMISGFSGIIFNLKLISEIKKGK
jgi:hypothetical protein